ncbi:MAG TPA: carboxypeptidase regulatory-like domain-containing protein [Vicinamibacterales bacterium]|jgi:hypothetical protein
MKTFTGWIFAALGLLLASAAGADAQSIAGTVRDPSGAVMPGVTVEASSPALIEKVRAVVTDGSGQYKIVNLRPGLYIVVFTLPGFTSVRREGIELTGDFTASVNAELKVGALEETITVAGGTPLVDVQSVTKQTVFTREVLDVLPAPRSIQGAAVLIPGVTTPGAARDVGGTTRLQQPNTNFRGIGGNIQRWDSFHLGNLAGANTGGGTSFYVNDAGAQELVYSSGADSAEMAFPGLYIDMVPKDGGNRFSGLVFGDFTHTPWSASNLSDDLRARGINDVVTVYHISDFNPGFGGPIKKDRLWFYAAYRYELVDTSVVDDYYDKNPAPYVYEPDFSRPAHDRGTIPNESVRVTFEATQKDKLQFWFTNQNKAREFYGISSQVTPDGAGRQSTRYAQPITLKWTRTHTNKLLFEGGFAVGRTYFDNGYRESVTTSFDRETIQNTPIYAITDLANSKSFGASIAGYMAFGGRMQVGRFTGTYVSGAHAFKAGFEESSGHGPNGARSWYTGDLTMNFVNGAPSAVILRIPRDQDDGYGDWQFFVQDKWTLRRATINAGVRYDYLVGHVNDSTLPPSRWNAAQFFPGFEVEHWKDISPRFGISYDLFGNGKTALKWNIARYIAPESNGTAQGANPQTSIGRTDTRTWRDLNGDYTIYNADGSVQSNELGPTSNVNFGKVIPSTTTIDPATLNGWNARGATVEWQAIAQHQLTSIVALNAGYYFRSLGNQLVTDNTLLTGADFDGPFCITAPASADLPGGGGYPVCGLYDLKPEKRGQVQNNNTFARAFGGITDHYQGYDVGMTARLRGATFVQGGINGQRRVYDTCHAPILAGTTTPNQVDSPEAQFCRQVTPYRPDVKLAASHTLPYAIVVSGTYQFSPGPTITSVWNVPNSVIAPALGRNLSAGATATKSVSLIAPETLYGNYLRELDLRLSKRMTVGRYRLRGDLNLYNVFNNDFVSSFNSTFSTTAANQFMRPTGVLQGRLFKIGGQIEF